MLMPVEPRRAVRDARLSARVVRSTPLLYVDGADAALDRPAHVRSASGLVRVDGRLVAIQDDASFIAVIDPRTLRATALTLPAGADGRRQFDDGRGNKHLKLDLEACTVAPDDDGGQVLVAFGSGSLGPRECVVLARGFGGRDPLATLIPAPALYAALRACGEFSGSEMNVEGAACLDGAIRLFNRGNGAPVDGRMPVDATCDVDWSELRAHLAAPYRQPVPAIRRVTRYHLGDIGGCPLTFTDAAERGADVLFSAAAEDSPDAVRDGPVAGSALGIIAADGTVRTALVQGEDGAPLLEKVEGVWPDPADPARVLAVVDRDDPAAPSLLLEITLGGPWFTVEDR
jgi:hypothetical protein